MTVDLRTLSLDEDETPKIDFGERYPLLFNVARLFLASLGPDFENLPTILTYEDFKDVKEDETIISEDIFTDVPITGVGLIVRDSIESLLFKWKADFDEAEKKRDNEGDCKECECSNECNQLLTRVKRLKDLFESVRDFSFNACYVKFADVDFSTENSGIAYRKHNGNIVLVSMPASDLDRARSVLMKAALKKTRIDGPQDAVALLKALFGGDD